MEVDDAVQAVRLRYLTAIGVESWVRRSAPAAAVGVAVVSGHAATVDESKARVDRAVEQLAEEPVAAVRSLLDVERGAGPAEDATTRTPKVPGPEVGIVAEPEAPVTPEFRLLLLQLGGSLLLVDDALLDPGALRSEQMLLLGDLLRTAHLMVHGAAGGNIEYQPFYWPQVDDPALDQGPSRAREALAYHVRMRLDGGVGPLLLVSADSAAGPHSATAIARDIMASLDTMVVDISSALLEPQAPGRLRAEAWAALCRLEQAP